MGGFVSAPFKYFQSEVKPNSEEYSNDSKDLTIINDFNLNEEIQQVIDRNMDTINDLKNSENDSKLNLNDQAQPDQHCQDFDSNQSNQVQDEFLATNNDEQLLTYSDNEIVSKNDPKSLNNEDTSPQETDSHLLSLQRFTEQEMNNFDLDEFSWNSSSKITSSNQAKSYKNTLSNNQNQSSSNVTSKTEHSTESGLSELPVYQSYSKPLDFKTRGKRQKSSETDSLSSKSDQTTEDGDGYSTKSNKGKKRRTKKIKLNSFGQYTQ